MRHRLIDAEVIRPLAMTTVASMSPCRDVPQPVNVPSRQPTRAGSAAFGGSTLDAGSGVGAVAGVGAAGAAGGVVAVATALAATGAADAVELVDPLADDVIAVAPSVALLPFATETVDTTLAAAVAVAGTDAAAVALGFADVDALSPRVTVGTRAAAAVDAFVATGLGGAAAESATVAGAAASAAAGAPSLFWRPSLDVAAVGLTPFSSDGGRRRPSSSDANRSAASRVRRLPAE